MKKKKSMIGLVIKLLVITIATIFVFKKGWFLVGFLVCYELFMIILFAHFKTRFFKTKMYKSFARLYITNDVFTISFIILFPIEILIVILFSMLNYMVSLFIIFSMIQLIIDFIVTFEILPVVLMILCSKDEDI